MAAQMIMENKYPLHNRRRAVQLIILALVIGLCYFVWNNRVLDGKLKLLQEEYRVKAVELEKLNEVNAALKEEIIKKSAALVVLQKSNDSIIREATVNAYKKAASRSDADKLAAFNDLIVRAGRSYSGERHDNGSD